MDSLFIEYMMDELSILNNTDPTEEYYSEGAAYDFLNSVLSFFQRLINDLVTFGKKVKNDISSIIQKKQVHLKLKTLKKELNEQKDDGVKKIKMVDVYDYIDIYQTYEKKITKKLNTLSKGNFKTRENMLSVVENIESDLDEMDEKLDKILSNKVTVSINDAIKYVEDNLSGKSKVEVCFVDACHKIKDVSINVEHVIKDQSYRSDGDFKKEYASCIKRITSKASKKISKGFSKFIFAIVATFA